MSFQAALKEVLPNKHDLPGSETYERSNGSYFTLFESGIKPAAIAQPTTTQEVSSLIKKLHPLLLSREASIAIKGTGHTPFAGAANVQDGITINSQGLKGIRLEDNKENVTFGVGETWGSVYAELEKHELTIPGGRVGRVGVPGLTLGGGLSFYSTKHGFACDSVTDFEVVLASGDIVHANANENADLFLCLKGGLNNFGIVTSFSMKTIPSSEIWGGIAYFMPETFDQLVDATADFVDNDTDEDTHVISSAGYAFGQIVTTCCLYHVKGVKEAPALQRFTSLPGFIEQHSTLRTDNHINFCDEFSSFVKDGVRSFYATLTVKANAALLKEYHQVWLEFIEPLKPIEGLIFQLGCFPLTKAMLSNSRKSGGNTKEIDPADGPLFIILFNPTWSLPEDDEKIHNAVEELLQKFRSIASDKGLLHRYIFTNYGYYKDDVLAGYGESSVRRMWEVSKKYDPHGIFQKAMPGGFKLPSI